MFTYKSDEKIKKMLVEEIRRHRENDTIMQGEYESGGKFCAVGCAIHSMNVKLGKEYATNDYSSLEKEEIYPEWLARLEDTIFEGLPKEDAMLWPEQFAEAVPVGVDVTPVMWKFYAFSMREDIEKVSELDISEDLKKKIADAFRQALALYEKAIAGGEWDEDAARSACAEARRIILLTERSEAYSTYTTLLAAFSATYAPCEVKYRKHAKELLRLLKEAE